MTSKVPRLEATASYMKREGLVKETPHRLVGLMFGLDAVDLYAELFELIREMKQHPAGYQSEHGVLSLTEDLRYWFPRIWLQGDVFDAKLLKRAARLMYLEHSSAMSADRIAAHLCKVDDAKARPLRRPPAEVTEVIRASLAALPAGYTTKYGLLDLARGHADDVRLYYQVLADSVIDDVQTLTEALARCMYDRRTPELTVNDAARLFGAEGMAGVGNVTRTIAEKLRRAFKDMPGGHETKHGRLMWLHYDSGAIIKLNGCPGDAKDPIFS